MGLYYTLAEARHITPHASGYLWPYEVAICFEPVDFPVILSEGVAHGAVSVPLAAAQALAWEEHFAKAEGTWLLPAVHRMAAGEKIAAAEFLALYEHLHKCMPASFIFPA